jgi:hypothetical protein
LDVGQEQKPNLETGMMRKVICLGLLALLLAACGKQVPTQPTLTLIPRPDLQANPPINLVVLDDQASERSGYAAQLAKTIQDAYPRAISAPMQTTPAPQQVTLKLHIRYIGASFNQTKDAVLSNQTVDPPRGNAADWQPLVTRAIGLHAVSSGWVYKKLPGNWSGIAHIDIEVTDRRPGAKAAFRFPLVAERSAGNDFGYARAQMVASDAWSEIGPRLAHFLDSAVHKVVTEGPRRAALN